MFSAFLTTNGGEQVRPALLVRSGTGIPNWISPFECQKLAVGTSSFECCENNHIFIKECRRSICLKSLDNMIETRVCSLFSSHRFAEARFTLCFRNHWCRRLSDANRKTKLRGRMKKERVVEVLGKRISTATPIQHEMWLISLENLLMLYGEKSRGRVMEVHQELKRQEFLTPFESSRRN